MSSQSDINNMTSKLQDLIYELDSEIIAIASDFQEIGNNSCVQALETVWGNLRDAKKDLS